MIVVLKIIICLITILIPVSGIECELHVALEGNGYLYEHTNMGEAKEFINAHGEQTYDRYYVNQDVRGLYVSNYSLMKYWPNNESRTYAISARLPDGLVHFAKISSKEGIFASNWIDNNNKTVATKFQISGNGSLSEGVATKGSRSHYDFLEETSAIGKVKLLSGIKNNVRLIPDSDADRLKNSLDSVSLTSESGKIDVSFPETIVFINGEKRNIIKSDQRISEIVGDRQVELISPYGISSESNKSEQIDKLKTMNTSIVENFNGKIIAWPNESKNKVDILDSLDIDPTSNLAPGKKANFSLTVFNTGSLGLTRVSAAIHLPPELDYADSNPEGIYHSGDIYWPNIGEILPDDKMVLNFSAAIKNVLPYTINKLNCTGEIIAIAQDGTTMAKPIFRRLNIIQPYLSIEKYADKTAISVGQMVTYTMNMRNIGNVVLHNISVIEKMADGMEFISSTSGFLNSSNGLVTYNCETLLPGEVKTLTYVAKAPDEFSAERMLQSIVYVTANTDGGLLAEAENISEILLSNNSNINTNNLNQKLRIKEVPGTEKKLDTINFNFTSNSNKVVQTGDEIIFNINLSPIGKSNLDNVSMYINVDKGLDIIQLPWADFIINNNTIYWPKINLTAGNQHGSFVAKVKDTNVNTERLNIIARLINEKDKTIIDTKFIELKFELKLMYKETDYSIIAQQKEDLVQEREILVRDHRQLGKKLIWDSHSWVGRVVPRPDVVDPFIDEISSDNVDNKSPIKIIRIGRV